MELKELLIVGGPNGAGETTIALEYVLQRGWPFLSADAIAEKLAPDDPAAARIAAGVQFVRQLETAIDGDGSVIVESTLAGRTLQKRIEVAKRSGFLVTIVFAYLDRSENCIDRVQERIRKGGHAVPEDDIRRRFHRSFANFWTIYRQLADHWQLVYNSGRQPEVVAAGSLDSFSVYDTARFARFQTIIEGNRSG